MKASLVSLALIACCTTLAAQPAPKVPAAPGATQTTAANAPHAMDATTLSNMLARTGGMLQVPNAGPSIRFLNTQTRVSSAAIVEVPDQINKILRLSTTLQDCPSAEPVTEAQKALADKNTVAVVVLADTPGYPSLLVAPENRWALVNVAALSGDGVSGAVLAERVQKETWRAFGYLMGAANSTFEHCLLKPVFAPADLDALKMKSLCPEPFSKIMFQAMKLGMKPAKMVSYRKAVEEGWAPAPKNDFQRAIWAELKGK